MRDVVGAVFVDGRVKPGHDAHMNLPSLVMAELDPAIHVRPVSIDAGIAAKLTADS